MRTIATLQTLHANGQETATAIYDVLALADSGQAAFAVRRPLREGGAPLFFMAGTNPSLAVGEMAFEFKGQAFYMSTFYAGADALEFEDITASDRAAFGISDADVAVAVAAAHA